MADFSELNPPVDGAEVFMLSIVADAIVIEDDEGNATIVAKIEGEYINLVRLLLRQAQLGAQTERLLDHYIKDTSARGAIPCPIWRKNNERET